MFQNSKSLLAIPLFFLSFAFDAQANFEQKKTETLNASRTSVMNIKKQCGKNIAVSIDWTSFQNNEQDLKMVPAALQQLSALLADNYSDVQKKGRCAELQKVRMVYNKKTSKALNFGLLSLIGNGGSQSFTKEDFATMFQEAMGFTEDKKKLMEDLAQGDSKVIKKACEKDIKFKVDWASVKEQKRDKVGYLSMIINQMRNTFNDLQHKGKQEKACEATNAIVFGLAAEPYIELQGGVLKSYTTKGHDRVNNTIALTPRLEQGSFPKATESNWANTSPTASNTRSPSSTEKKEEKTELERDLENDANDVKNDVKNDARRRTKNKVKDSIKDTLFKGF